MHQSSELRRDTPAWIIQVWISFLGSVAAGAIGIYYAPVDLWVQAYLGMAFVFALGSAFSLAKTVRDNHEGGKIVNRLHDAKAEQMLRDYEVGSAPGA